METLNPIRYDSDQMSPTTSNAADPGGPGFDLQIAPREGESVSFVVRGRIGFDNVEQLEQAIRQTEGRFAPVASWRIDVGGVRSTGSALAILLRRLRRECEARGVRLRIENPDEITRRILDRSEAEVDSAAVPETREADLPTQVGELMLRSGSEFLNTVQYVGTIVLAMLLSLRSPGKIRWGEVATLIRRTGADALPIVALLSFLVGLVTAFSAAIQLRQFGANIFIADMVGIGMTRELGPLLAAILMTGRSGSAFAAEIGTMRISDELDALAVMRIDPLDFLVMPRLFAVMLTLPLLALFADLAGILGGALIGVTRLGLTAEAFANQLGKAVDLWDVFSGVLKAFVFGILVAGVGCYRGLLTRGGALGVGRSTTAAVVAGIFLIIVADSVFVVLFHYLGL
jgi:phospholipid/cholesterol/gamma-HCH transport system permease protein